MGTRVSAITVAVAIAVLGSAMQPGTADAIVFCQKGGANKVTVRSVGCKGKENQLGVDLVGERGDKGDRGEPGERGEGGLTGATGATGAPGLAGSQGPPGPTEPGIVVPFAGPAENIPEGWLLCDGGQESRFVYPELFEAIGFAHGKVGANTFLLPDYRGMFLRGVDHGRRLDPGATDRAEAAPGGEAGDEVGSIQFDDLMDHAHGVVGSVDVIAQGWLNIADIGDGHNVFLQGMDLRHDLRTTQQITEGDGETRPVNAYVNWIIKY